MARIRISANSKGGYVATKHTLDDQQMIDILEEIARDERNRAAQISAIRQLREIRGGKPVQSEDFAGLYAVKGAKAS
jgi:hypothetical protein